MSYILDALNKSEQERRNRQTPGLDSIHTAPLKIPQPKRFWLLLFAILVTINGSFVYWFISKPTENKASTASGDQGRELSGRQVARLADVVGNPAPRTVASNAPVSIAELPVGIQRQIPDIRFASHIYASDPTLRMVNINGRIFREGDTVADGISLVEISEDGVVLGYLHHRIKMSILRDWTVN